MNLALAFALSVLVQSGELTPNITRNQIAPTYYGYGGYGAHGPESSGYWQGEYDEKATTILNDVRVFGLTCAQAESNYQLAVKERDRSDEVWCWNREWVHVQWEADIRFRYRAWGQLSCALEVTRPLRDRLRSLDELLELIGPENFFAGVMPGPRPNYRVNDTTWKDRR